MSETFDWLLDSDPSIRWQVKRDLLDEPEAAVARERSRVAVEGWGARLLDLQGADGHWGGAAFVPDASISTMDTLSQLRQLGVDPAADRMQQAIALVSERCTWGPEFGDSPFFEGEVEPCINGVTLATGAYFGKASARLAARLLGEQLSDGGWNCDAPPSRRSSFHSTICVSRVCWHTRSPPVRGPTSPRPVFAGRSTSWSATCSDRCRQARSSPTIGRRTRRPDGRSLPSRRGGGTTSSGGSSTCGAPASHPTHAPPRPSRSSGRSATRAGAGRSRTRLPVRFISRWKGRRVNRAAGTRCARSACFGRCWGARVPGARVPGAGVLGAGVLGCQGARGAGVPGCRGAGVLARGL